MKIRRDPEKFPNYIEKMEKWKQSNRQLRRENIIFQAEKLAKEYTSPDFNPATYFEDSKLQDFLNARDMKKKSKKMVNTAIFKARVQINGGDKFAAKFQRMSKCETVLYNRYFISAILITI